jgi:hypothetical protein
MLEAYRELEAVTLGLEWHGLGVTFFTPDMMMKHWKRGAMATELVEDRRGYERALAAVRRAQTRSNGAAPGYLEYWVGRLEFGIQYLDAVEKVRNAATAEAEQRYAAALNETTAALESARHAIETYAGVAKDRSDVAAVAMMNEFVYRPLRAKKTALEEAHP